MKTVLAAAILMACFAGSAAAQSPAGKGWTGEWVSDTTGHRGPLKANVKPLSNGDYRVRYSGRFAKVIPFYYPATMKNVGTGPNGEIYLTNTTRMPFFGTFHADGVLTGTSFESQYTSKRDSGRFTLSR